MQVQASPKRTDWVGSFWFILGYTSQNYIYLLIYVHTYGTGTSCVYNLETTHQGWTLPSQGRLSPRPISALLYRTWATKPVQRGAQPWRLSQLLSPVVGSLWPVNHVALTEALGKAKAGQADRDSDTPHTLLAWSVRESGWSWGHPTLTGQAQQLLGFLGTSLGSWALSCSVSPLRRALSVQQTGLDQLWADLLLAFLKYSGQVCLLAWNSKRKHVRRLQHINNLNRKFIYLCF